MELVHTGRPELPPQRLLVEIHQGEAQSTTLFLRPIESFQVVVGQVPFLLGDLLSWELLHLLKLWLGSEVADGRQLTPVSSKLHSGHICT